MGSFRHDWFTVKFFMGALPYSHRLNERIFKISKDACIPRNLVAVASSFDSGTDVTRHARTGAAHGTERLGTKGNEQGHSIGFVLSPGNRLDDGGDYSDNTASHDGNAIVTIV
ncbi:hypothetical protein EJB05_51454, partial [Eragrostis curvula]